MTYIKIKKRKESGETRKLLATYVIKRLSFFRRIRNALGWLGESKIMGPPILLYCVGILLGGILAVGIITLKLRSLFIIVWMMSVFCVYFVWLPLFSRLALRILNKVAEAERNEKWILDSNMK